jgi:hypothetical protein
MSDEIESDNIRVMGILYAAATLEELQLFAVMDRLVQLFEQGLLPIRGPGVAKIDRYRREAPNRLNDEERRNLYAAALGVPGGAAGGHANRDFNELWMRFVSSVAALARRRPIQIPGHPPRPASQRDVRRAGFELAANMSAHGREPVRSAGGSLSRQIADIVSILSDPEIEEAYGARDMWQLIDEVATRELGGAQSTSRYRALATSGAIITAWLAGHVERLSSTVVDVIDAAALPPPDPPTFDPNATAAPTDCDLVNACLIELELRIASQPASMVATDQAPRVASGPLPRAAQNLIEQAGIAFGAGAGRCRV